MDDVVTLCGASCYTKKFYLNEDFEVLPQAVRDELKILCVLHTEEVGGIITMQFNEDGALNIFTSCDEGDFFYDEIGAALKVKQYMRERKELIESLELFYKVVYVGVD